MRHVGAALQLVGLVLLPVGLVLGLANGDTRAELALLGVGAVLFLAGKGIVSHREGD